jgi:hypothetical protein
MSFLSTCFLIRWSQVRILPGVFCRLFNDRGLRRHREFEGKALEMFAANRAGEIGSRLELYKQGKPYHEPPVKK